MAGLWKLQPEAQPICIALGIVDFKTCKNPPALILTMNDREGNEYELSIGDERAQQLAKFIKDNLK